MKRKPLLSDRLAQERRQRRSEQAVVSHYLRQQRTPRPTKSVNRPTRRGS